MSGRPVVRRTSTLLQCGSKILTIHLYFQILSFWFGDRRNKDENLCTVAPHSGLPIHSIVQRIFEHVHPCRRTTLKFLREISAIVEIFQLLQQKYGIQTFCCIVPMIFSLGLHSHWVHPKYAWSRNCVGSSISTFVINFFRMGAIFCFFPAILMSSTSTEKI